MASRNLSAERYGSSYLLTYAQRAWDAWQARAALSTPPMRVMGIDLSEDGIQIVRDAALEDAALECRARITGTRRVGDKEAMNCMIAIRSLKSDAIAAMGKGGEQS